MILGMIVVFVVGMFVGASVVAWEFGRAFTDLERRVTSLVQAGYDTGKAFGLALAMRHASDVVEGDEWRNA